MKVTKKHLREVLREEIRVLVKEEVRKQLKKEVDVKKWANSEEPFELESIIEEQEPSQPKLKESYDITDPQDLKDLIGSTKVPKDYYQSPNPPTGSSTQLMAEQQAAEPVNVTYKPKKVKEATEVKGENLNELENTDFSSFV